MAVWHPSHTTEIQPIPYSISIRCMPTKQLETVDRRRLLQILGVSGIAGLAGCAGIGDDDDPAADDDPADDDPDDGPADDPADDPDDEDSPDETELEPMEKLVQIFDDQPFNDAQFEIDGEERSYTPRHVWKFVSDESLIGLHVDEPNPEEATELDYVTIGRKGLFSEESQPGPEFTHFHKVEADSWEGGHGGEEGDEGYWLTHLATREIQYPFHGDPIGPRVDYEFMPTPPPDGSEGHSTEFESPSGDEGSLSADDRDALIEAFDHQPFSDDQLEIDGQYTPRHIWFEANDDVVVFLHFDEPNPAEANELDYFGIGVRSQFTAADIPAAQTDDFSHFHKVEADSWEGGHGGQDVEDEGYWLVHHSVREVQYPFHDEPIDIGIDREFMPTPAPDIEEFNLQQLVQIFDDQPFNDAQFEIEGEERSYTPRHVWKFVSDESFIGLHFDEPNPEAATALDYVTIGRKGIFTEESQPDDEFTHFHKVEADSWEGGHGGEEGDEGYWLTHLAAQEIQYPFHGEPIGPRVDYEFMPTPPPEGSAGHSVDFESPAGDEGSLSPEDRDALLRVFDHEPFNAAQHEIEGGRRDYTPRHVWFEANDDVILFLHFDEPNPERANELDYFGIGVQGQFTADDIPAGQSDDFSHFHQAEADGWDAGHGGSGTDDEGYWLAHHAVREVQYPFHGDPIDIGIDREFMPTPAPDAE